MLLNVIFATWYSARPSSAGIPGKKATTPPRPAPIGLAHAALFGYERPRVRTVALIRTAEATGRWP
jgi:hypothetical protein